MQKAFSKRSHREPNAKPETPFSDIKRKFLSNRTKTATIAGLSAVISVSGAQLAAASTDNGGIKGVDVAAIAKGAKAALKTNPQVSVSEKTEWGTTSKTTAKAIEKPKIADTVATAATPDRENTRYTSRNRNRNNNFVSNVAERKEQRDVTAPLPPSKTGNATVDIAMRYVGVPYVWGGSTPAGFDCSGFVKYVFAQQGIELPRVASAQGRMGVYVPYPQAVPGDTLNWGHHVAIYLGNGMMIDAPKPGDHVRVRPVWGSPQVRRITK